MIMTNNMKDSLSVRWRLIGLALSALLITGCATNPTACIQGKGEWLHGTYNDTFDLEDKKINRGESFDYFITLACWGRYDFDTAVRPMERFILGVVDGRNRYYEEAQEADGTLGKRFLPVYEIDYHVEITSLDHPDKPGVIEQGKQRESGPIGLAPMLRVRVPKDFSSGERLRLRIAIEAEESFYADFGMLGVGVVRNWRSH